MITFELDPNLVKPGWTALIIVIVLALILVGLYFSMMRQMRKIKVPPAGGEAAAESTATPEPESPDPSAPEPDSTQAEPDRSRQRDSAT